MKKLLCLIPLAALSCLPFLSGCCTPVAAHTNTAAYKPAPVPATTPLPPRAVVSADSLELKCETAVPTKTVRSEQVQLRKIVETQNVVVPVTLSRDTYVVERTPASGAPQTPFAEAQTSLTLNTESAYVTVVPQVNEIVRLRKVTTQYVTNLNGTVRCEKLVVGP